MTREEAVIILDGFKNNPLFSDTHVQALDMAISALSTEGEYIKKEEAISKILIEFVAREEKGNVICACAEAKQTCADILDGLPTYSFPDSAKTDTAKPESDLISRTQAINDYAQCFADKYGMDCGEMFIGVLHQCPTFPDSAENKGEWISSYGNVKCSVCGMAFDSREVGKATHYCSFCGADMRGE